MESPRKNQEFIIEQSSDKNEKMSYQLKIESCRKFSQKYLGVLAVLFTLIIFKRLLFEQHKDFTRLFFHITIIALAIGSLRLNTTHEFATRGAPYVITLLSFFGHMRYLKFNTISGEFSTQQSAQLRYQDDDINEVLRAVVLCAACFINHMYVDLFLTVTQKDSIIINMVTWGLFTGNTFVNHCKNISN